MITDTANWGGVGAQTIQQKLRLDQTRTRVNKSEIVLLQTTCIIYSFALDLV